MASGSIDLATVSCIELAETGNKGFFSFVVQSEERCLFLRAESKARLTYWTTSLRMHLNLLHGGTTHGPKCLKNTPKRNLEGHCEVLARNATDALESIEIQAMDLNVHKERCAVGHWKGEGSFERYDEKTMRMPAPSTGENPGAWRPPQPPVDAINTKYRTSLTVTQARRDEVTLMDIVEHVE